MVNSCSLPFGASVFSNPTLHAAAAASRAEQKETKKGALAPSPGTLTVVVSYV